MALVKNEDTENNKVVVVIVDSIDSAFSDGH